MRVAGLFLVRNEIDIIEANLRHHLATAINEAIVVDNGSTDGTFEFLAALARDLPIVLISEPGPYHQAELTNRMARLAGARGADWVLPIDADEFWIGSERPLRELLADCPPEVGVLLCDVVNFVQRRDVGMATPAGLLTMTMRVAEPGGTVADAQELVESGQIAFVEMRYPPKCVSRASGSARIHTGNHDVDGVPGERQVNSEILCLHAPLRARSSFAGKLDQGRRVTELNYPPGLAWHVRRWWQLARARRLDEEWAANSYQDGALGAGSSHRPLVEDLRLRQVVEPWIGSAHAPPTTAPVGLSPVVASYLLALRAVPGWFSELDLRLFAAIDEAQKAESLTGDLFEIGAYCGKSAVLLGYLAGSDEKLVVCDLFNLNNLTTDENRAENERWYPGFGRNDFEFYYGRFHQILPDLIVGPSNEIDRERFAGSCRLVHIDGSHNHSIVREDIATARAILKEGGVVTLDDISTAHNPGSAIAAWEAVLGGVLHPVCLTDAKLYGCFDSTWELWAKRLRAWAEMQPDIRSETHNIAGYELARLIHEPRPASGVDQSALATLPPVADALAPSVTDASGYDDAFYDFASDAARSSAEEIVPLLLDLTGAGSVVDVGCGMGTWLAVFEQHGVTDLLGIDGAHVDTTRLEIDRRLFRMADLEHPPAVGRTFDLALSLEVAEHLSAEAAGRFVEGLTRLAPVVCFSAAIPLQGGVGHVNEQWPGYWIERFAQHDFVVIDPIRPLVWSNPRVAMWYSQNLLVFARTEVIERRPTLTSALEKTRARQLDLVHPSLFLYHMLHIPGMALTLPLDAASRYALRSRPTTPSKSPSPAGPVSPSVVPELSLRALLQRLPAAFERAARSRVGRARDRWRSASR